jgi:transcriptional regulator with XRE-family HTH domain
MSVVSACASVTMPIPPIAEWGANVDNVPVVVANPTAAVAPPISTPVPARPLHHLRDVRRREGITRRKVGRLLGIPIREVERQERPSSDILLSDLHRWQKALGVPLAELLDEPDGILSPPVELRARLLRIMKTARSIQHEARQVSIQRFAEMLVDQLVEIMPELKDTMAWNAVGARRGRDELGQAFFRGALLDSLNELDRDEE